MKQKYGASEVLTNILIIVYKPSKITNLNNAQGRISNWSPKANVLDSSMSMPVKHHGPSEGPAHTNGRQP